MDFLGLGLLVVAFLLAGPIAFFITLANRSRIAELEHAVASLRTTLRDLRAQAAPAVSPAPAAPEARSGPLTPPGIVTEPPRPAPAIPEPRPFVPAPPPTVPPAGPRPAPAPRATLERQFGGRAFVWLGGIALAFAGFFLVKYSIDTGLLTEKVRVILGVLFGLALLGGSHWVRQQKDMADGTRIAQALAGAGIAVLYGSLFAATTLYHLLPAWLGFALMAVVTASALLLSLRHGAPIAALGLIGGYATPLMVAGEPNAPLLFSYLYLVFGGLSLLVRRQHWQWLGVPATLIAFAWVGLWLVEGLAARDGAALSLFLAGVAATAVLVERGPDDASAPPLWLKYLAPAGSLLLMAGVTYATHFGTFEWAMFGLISAGAIVLAWFDERRYAFVPWLAMGANLAMLIGWNGAAPSSLAAVIAAFALLFFASGQVILPRSRNPLSWAGLSAAAALAYYLLAYARLDAALTRSVGANADTIWALIAVTGAALLTYAVTRDFVTKAEKTQRQLLQAVFAATATALLSLGFTILLTQDFLPTAIAAEILALAWIGTRVDIPPLREIALALSVVYAGLAVLAALPMFEGLSEPAAANAWHLAQGALFRFAVPASLLFAAAGHLRKTKDDPFVAALEFAAVMLVAVAIYRWIAIIYAGYPAGEALLVQSLVNCAVLLLALGSLWAARLFARPALFWSGVALSGIVLARLVVFNLVEFNPIWSHQFVGATPFGVLFLAYALPAIAAVRLARDFQRDGRKEWASTPAIAGFVLAFVFVTFGVRQLFGGAYLDDGHISNAEVYTYSAVWLVCGVGLLMAAVLRREMALRIASLVVMLLTVGKVFLYDASELTGLWRVVSFLGLGLCLLALSWFYSRFVFTSESSAQAS
jgi:uncharacterized membrane protein